MLCLNPIGNAFVPELEHVLSNKNIFQVIMLLESQTRSREHTESSLDVFAYDCDITALIPSMCIKPKRKI
jgi:hypothetical protein